MNGVIYESEVRVIEATVKKKKKRKKALHYSLVRG